METGAALRALTDYAEGRGLLAPCDRVWAENRLLEVLGLDAAETPETAPAAGLEEILDALTDDAAGRGLCGPGPAARDLFDTRLMGALTPPPREVQAKFAALCARAPAAATDWFYGFCQDVNYIRRYRTARDLRWRYASDYGALDITVNLAKPEKDPRDIAAAGRAGASGYPKCVLCRENEGYAGRPGHPARQNLRLIPVTLSDGTWYFQYSPYVYYNEHCLLLSPRHEPMRIDGGTFRRLLEFVTRFPHYFMGSNADLPIVGGSILSHDHFQGGRYAFPMEKAPVETALRFRGFEGVAAGVVRWPMPTLRLRGDDPAALAALAEKLLGVWRGYTDAQAGVFAQTAGVPHNTVTPIARRRGADWELDLILRSNLTSAAHPLGVFHPHEDLHHIKKENIGLIEAMGLAVLPARLRDELAGVKSALLTGADLRADPALRQHADWAEALRADCVFTAENADGLLQDGVGRVFQRVLEDAGVFKRTPAGRAALLRFAAAAGAV